jgi:hypothetical protein
MIPGALPTFFVGEKFGADLLDSFIDFVVALAGGVLAVLLVLFD